MAGKSHSLRRGQRYHAVHQTQDWCGRWRKKAFPSNVERVYGHDIHMVQKGHTSNLVRIRALRSPCIQSLLNARLIDKPLELLQYQHSWCKEHRFVCCGVAGVIKADGTEDICATDPAFEGPDGIYRIHGTTHKIWTSWQYPKLVHQP